METPLEEIDMIQVMFMGNNLVNLRARRVVPQRSMSASHNEIRKSLSFRDHRFRSIHHPGNPGK